MLRVIPIASYRLKAISAFHRCGNVLPLAGDFGLVKLNEFIFGAAHNRSDVGSAQMVAPEV